MIRLERKIARRVYGPIRELSKKTDDLLKHEDVLGFLKHNKYNVLVT